MLISKQEMQSKITNLCREFNYDCIYSGTSILPVIDTKGFASIRLDSTMIPEESTASRLVFVVRAYPSLLSTKANMTISDIYSTIHDIAVAGEFMLKFNQPTEDNWMYYVDIEP